jgi:glycosyltransferase 2 family protein
MRFRMPASRRKLIVLAKLVVSVGLLALLLSCAGLPALAERFRGMDGLWMAAALGFYGLMIWVSAWRWRLLLDVQAVRVPSRTLSESFLVATFFNNFLPSNIGGDVVRIADTAPLAGTRTLATTVVLLDRGLGLLALFAVAAAGSLLAARQGLQVPGAGYLWIVLVVTLAGLTALLRRPGLFAGLLRPPLHWLRADWVLERLRQLGSAMHRFGRRPATLVLAFGGALVVQLLLVAFFFCTARSLNIPFGLVAAAMVVPIALVAQMVPISINGFGVREAVFSWFFSRLGLDLASALALSLASAGLIMLFSLSGGMLFLCRPGAARRGAGTDAPGAER